MCKFKLIFLLFIYLISIKVSYSQFENIDIGARSTALSGAFTSLSNNSNALFYNPGGLAQLKFREFSVSYSPAPYGMTELSTSAITFAEPTKYGVFGLGFKNYGYELYRELNAIVNYSYNYDNKIFYGVNLNFYHLSIKNYNTANSIGIDAGVLAYITEFMRFGFMGKNLTGSTIGQSKEKIAQVYKTGLSFQPQENFNILLEVEKDVKFPLSFRAGLEYSFMDYIDLRGGVGTEPSIYSGGIGINYDVIQLDYSLHNSVDLGLTHQVGVTVNFGGKKAREMSKDQLKNSFKK